MRRLTTLTDPCIDCWVTNMGCTVAHCFAQCVLRWENPLSAGNNPASGGEGSHAALNSCLLCDEQHCSPRFIRSCGANRRMSGTATDITRPPESVCRSVNVLAAA
eukprot:TRINITY_DN13555_c0_g1_i3.p5 TRINITY_DN13555_c0_g1~~TRINITY_DN13555_c0_g1_i3.p5  ORF type:complete len:105 (+),score=19.84 TRINITY_DN13555_c0_g1_i3:349-663(+)